MSQLCECGCGQATPVAQRTNRQRGHVRGVSTRFVAGHNNRLRMVGFVEEDRGHATPCWIWQGSLNHNGYGRCWGGMAHVRYYEDRHGAVPDGLTLDHLCRVRACVNPDHLEAVPPAENTRRGTEARYRARAGLHPLTAARLDAGLSQRQLAALLGISQSAVSLWEHERVAPDGQAEEPVMRRAA